MGTCVAVALAGCAGDGDTVGPTTETPPTLSDAPDYDGWVGDTPTYDRRDASSVTVYVGTQGRGGYYAFEPAAVAVTPGTTVTFRWTGRGGMHNVVGLDRDIRSELTAEQGHRFTHEVGDPGTVKYYCGPHRSRGMRGVLLVRES